MRNLLTSVCYVVSLALFMAGCNETSEEIALEPDRKLSEIDLLEKDMGVSLFKAEMVLTDNSNTNTVTLKVASQSEKDLKHYLANNDFSIQPVYAIQQPQKSTDKLPLSIDRESVSPGSSRIYSEVVAQSLAPDVIGYAISIQKSGNVNGRTNANGYTYSLSVISGEWPFSFGINSTVNVGVSFKIKRAQYDAWESYVTICNLNTSTCDYYHTNNGFGLYDLAEYYKAQVFVDYNNISDITYYAFM